MPSKTIKNPTHEQFVGFLTDSWGFWKCNVCDALTHPAHSICGSCRTHRHANRLTVFWNGCLWKLYRRRRYFKALENPDYMPPLGGDDE